MGQSTPKPAVIYCRVSTHDQSCERQERDLLAFAERAGYQVLQVFKETASGSKDDRTERKKILALAQRREIQTVLVTELTRWGRSTRDLMDTLQTLESYRVSVIAQTGLQFDLTSPQGKLFASLMSALAEFERDLLRERVRSGIQAAKARGVKFGRQTGDDVKVKKFQSKIQELHQQGMSYRAIAKRLEISKNTVMKVLQQLTSPKSRGE